MEYLGLVSSMVFVIEATAKLCQQLEIFKQAPEVYKQLVEEVREVSSVLQALGTRCARTGPIEIGFVSDIDLATRVDAPNHLRSRQLLQRTGLSRYSNWNTLEGSSKENAESSLNYRQRVLSLRKSLEKHAAQSRLILVCGLTEAPLIQEALVGQSPAQKDWFSRRVAGLVLFDNRSLGYLQAPQNQSKRSRISVSDSTIFTRNQESNSTSTKYNGLPRTAPSIFAIPGIFTIWVRRFIYSSGAETRRGLRRERHVTYGVEITCPAEETADCTAWAILYLIEALERDAHAHQVTNKSLRSPGKFSRSVNALGYALRDRTTAETKAIFEALQWVAFALRPLEQQELSEALGTDLAFDVCSKASHKKVDKKQYGREILRQCREILKVDENGLVDFHDTEMRVFVLSPEFVQMTGLHMIHAHEMIATVCVRHLLCESAETILKPWVSTGRWLRAKELKCHLWSYSVTFWPDHYRIAQYSSRFLSAMLHQAILAAVTASAEQEFADGPKSKIKMNSGLEICSKYDLYILGQTYLEMGADIDGGAHSTTQPLTLAVMNKSYRMITILLDSGADPSLPDKDGFTALGCAYESGDLMMINTLIQRCADTRTKQCSSPSTGQLAGNEDYTPSFIANRHEQEKDGSLPLTATSAFDLSTPANDTMASFCQSFPLINTCLVHHVSNDTKCDSITETTRNLEMLSLPNTQVRYSPNCSKIQHAEQDTWLLISFEDFGAGVT